MSVRLPIEIRRNYTIKDVSKNWSLICIVCSQQWQMAKPEKGKKLHAGNILALLDHAASHPLPTEEEVGQAPPQFVEESLPVSQVNTKPLPYSIASSKSPNAYKVNRNKKIVRASHFREVDYTGYGQVEHSNLGYSVVLFAANAKHASLIGLRLIQQFIDTKKEGS